MSSFTFRIPDKVHTKARVLGAFKNLSLNEICVRALDEYVAAWEAKHGELPMPPDDA